MLKGGLRLDGHDGAIRLTKNSSPLAKAGSGVTPIKRRVRKDRHGYLQDDHPHSHDLFIQA
ncbi:hypothetical protein [Synechococcus sp. WH 8016]|uniref:hypothetical protein n=1 Tax=Synechococcus sp. WH 8016 TaxID=166318 RepID=UPI0003130A5D|nr:hypothetical protein [Synechococcus sp. WH 8016]